MRSFALAAILAASVFALNDSTFVGPEIASLTSTGSVSWELLQSGEGETLVDNGIDLKVTSTMTLNDGAVWQGQQQTYICMPDPIEAETETCLFFQFFNFADQTLKYLKFQHAITEEYPSWITSPPTADAALGYAKMIEEKKENGATTELGGGTIIWADGVADYTPNNDSSFVSGDSSVTETNVTGIVRFFITDTDMMAIIKTCGAKLEGSMGIWQQTPALAEGEEAPEVPVVDNANKALTFQIKPLADADSTGCPEDSPAKNPEAEADDSGKVVDSETDGSAPYLATSLAAIGVAFSAIAF